MNTANLIWLAILSGAAVWTIFFSMFNAPGIRGWRNLGWLACYITGLGMAFALPWRSSLATWVILGLSSGLFYFAYECYGYLRSRTPDAKPRLTTIVHGLFLWPIMLPEAVEYWLTDLGILKAPASPPEQP